MGGIHHKIMGSLRRIAAGEIIVPVLLFFFMCVFTVVQTSCGENQSIVNAPPSFSYSSPDKGIPKLDSQLSQLVRAAERGEAASFAQQHGLEISDGMIRVIIECKPGLIEDARKAANGRGAKEETFYGDMLQALVPVAGLEALAGAESILFIRLPQKPLLMENTEN